MGAARRSTLVLDEPERKVQTRVPERDPEGIGAVGAVLADVVEHG